VCVYAESPQLLQLQEAPCAKTLLVHIGQVPSANAHSASDPVLHLTQQHKMKTASSRHPFCLHVVLVAVLRVAARLVVAQVAVARAAVAAVAAPSVVAQAVAAAVVAAMEARLMVAVVQTMGSRHRVAKETRSPPLDPMCLWNDRSTMKIQHAGISSCVVGCCKRRTSLPPAGQSPGKLLSFVA
jgi:hypothetical protein